MSHKILLVEDNPDILFNIKMMLEFNDFSVIEAKNGKEALKILENIDYTPDLVLSDIMMPEMDGWVFYKTLKRDSKYAKVPFIFISARSDPNEVKRGLEIGAEDYIIKPFTEDKLIKKIQEKI